MFKQYTASLEDEDRGRSELERTDGHSSIPREAEFAMEEVEPC